jgi:hypothetical protein
LLQIASADRASLRRKVGSNDTGQGLTEAFFHREELLRIRRCLGRLALSSRNDACRLRTVSAHLTSIGSICGSLSEVAASELRAGFTVDYVEDPDRRRRRRGRWRLATNERRRPTHT